MSSYSISVIPGDGIGPEVIAEGVKVLKKVGAIAGHSFAFSEHLAGGCAIDAHGTPLPDATLKGVKASHALLFGAIGGPKWEGVPHHIKPEAGLLKLRKELGAFANLRPAVVFDELLEASSIRPEVLKGTDIMVVRELTGGIYFGPGGITGDGAHRVGINTEVYSVAEIERIATIAFECAKVRRRKLCSVDKANVLVSSQLWREVVTALGKAKYPEVQLSHMYVDNCAMQLIRDPRQFDVIVTTNIFGDILSDEASQLTGSIGMLASASVGGPVGFFEPIHGSAPDIAGQRKANPLATIGTVALLLRYGLKLEKEAQLVETAVRQVLKDGFRTGDIKQPGCKLVDTVGMGEAVVERLRG